MGRIRLGQKVPVGTDGKTRPGKLDRFRFTSPQRDLIEAVAALYGGDARAWGNGGKPEFEVITAATSIPVIVVKGGLSQWMETWSGGGCSHRCDGYHDVITDSACDERDPKHQQAKPTTRLSVMLRDVESMGVWRMETHGWNAAAEIPAMAELAMYVGDLVPANLHLVERRTIKDGQTSRFVVPVLDLAISKQRLVAIVGQQTGAAASITAGSGAPQGVPQIAAAPIVDYLALALDATTVEEVRAIWQQAADAGHMVPSLDGALKARAAEVGQQRAAQIAPPAAPASDASSDEAEDFTLSADQQQAPLGAAAIWAQIVAEAGEQGWTTSQLLDAFDAFSGGVAVADADGSLMDDFADALRSGKVRQAVSA